MFKWVWFRCIGFCFGILLDLVKQRFPRMKAATLTQLDELSIDALQHQLEHMLEFESSQDFRRTLKKLRQE